MASERQRRIHVRHQQHRWIAGWVDCWRGLSDWAWVLDQLGDTAQARQVRDTAVAFRQAILAAVEKSERRDVQPPFIPIALFNEEKPYDTLTATRWIAPWSVSTESSRKD